MSYLKLFILTFFIVNFSFATAFDVKKAEGFNELESFIGSIKTMQGFGAQEYEGKKLPFKFFLSLPGKFSLDYQSPELPIKIILNNSVFTYYDKRMDQKTQLPVSSTIVSLLMVPRFSLTSEDLLIFNLSKQKNGYILEFEKKNFKEEGLFKLYFKKEEEVIKIEKLEVTNNKIKSVTTFDEMKINEPIKGNPFFIPNKKIY